MAASTTAIGTMRERPLHAALKRWYALPGDLVEAPIDGYVIDIVRDDLLIEVQTRGFAGVKPKVTALVEKGHRVRVVHPIAVDRWIVNVDADGGVVSRRRSPKHGTVADVASELVTFPSLLDNPGFEIEVVLTVEEEYRHLVPGRCWRRRGWTVLERRLVEVVDRVRLSSGADLTRLVPADLPEPFTTADLARAHRRPRHVAQQLAYCLRAAGVIDAIGKGRLGVEYRVAHRDAPAGDPR